MTAALGPDRIDLAPGLNISRMVMGLWQVADMERDGRSLDRNRAAAALSSYADAGFDSFDMADHYGSAEDIAGLVLQHRQGDAQAFTKWCPLPGVMTREVVRAGVQRSLDRLGVARIDLLQLHWWIYEHPAYLDAMRELVAMRKDGLIRELGVTNFNTDHLRLLNGQGFPVRTNQVSFSVLDRRAAGDMSAFCQANGVRLLAYGTLAGGLLSEKWLGAPEPAAGDLADWSKLKYSRFVAAIGGWGVLQSILAALAAIAKRHGVSIANVATRWVLEQPAVAAVIVGCRPGERDHSADNLRTFSFSLDAQDRARLAAAFAASEPPPGDCGDEYRKPPFLTASGDLSHHLADYPKIYASVPVPGRPGRFRLDTGSQWERVCGYSRAVRIGDRLLVSGTTATHGSGEVICPGDAACQTVYILDKIAASLSGLGASMADVVRTRIYMRDASQWEPVARVHGRVFGDVRPANTLVEVSNLVGDYAVEIEAEAIVQPGLKASADGPQSEG